MSELREQDGLRLAVLSRGARLYSTRRLVEEARKRGLDVNVLDPMSFSLFVDDNGIDVMHEGRPAAFDAVIPRIGHSITRHGVAVLRHLEQMGIWTANTGQGILQSRDKLHASQLLARNKIPVPRTVYVRDTADIEHAIEAVGGLPVVVKVTEGTQGQGVFLRHTYHETRNLVQGLLHTKKAILIQEYIAESHGTDIRALVVGDRVVACMRRRARGREFRSNFHLNGTVEPVDLDPAFEEVACRAARVLGLRVAGVDLLESEDGPLVLEVNSSPGLEGIEKASGVNVAGEIIDFVINDAVFTEVELDKLLRTVPGEGVLSIQLLHHPNLIGHSIGEIFANSEQPPVYALSRGVKMMWNPEPSVQLRYDDVLICYGELESLRATLRKAVLMSPPIITDSPSSEETNA